MNLAHQLSFAAYAEQLANKQGLAKQLGIEREATVISTVEMTPMITDKAEVEGSIDLTQ